MGDWAFQAWKDFFSSGEHVEALLLAGCPGHLDCKPSPTEVINVSGSFRTLWVLHICKKLDCLAKVNGKESW